MATAARPKKLSRRNMIALLGSGTVAGAMGTIADPVEARGISCDNPAFVRRQQPARGRTRGSTGTPGLLTSESCCVETRAAILKGFAAGTTRGKTHLAPLKGELEHDTLEEFCVMVWGLTDVQRKELRNIVDAKIESWR